MFQRNECAVIGKIYRLLQGVHISPFYVAVPIILSIGSAAFEGVSIGLLIPLLNGFLQQDFTFIHETPIVGTVIDMLPDAVTGRDRSLFLCLMVFFVIAVVLKNILRYIAQVSMVYVAFRAMHHLRKIVFGRMLRFGKLYYDLSNVGQHSTVLMEFTTQAFRPLALSPKYVNATFSLVAYFFIMGSISWELTIIALPLFAVLHISVRSIINKLRNLSQSASQKSKDLGQKTVEILSNIPLVKAYATQRYEQDRYAKISDQKAELDLHAAKLELLIDPIHEIVTMFSALGLFACMLAFLTYGEGHSAPSLIVYFYAVLNAANKFGTVTHLRSVLAKATGPLSDIEHIFTDEDKYMIASGEDEFPGLQKNIVCKDLSFTYPDGTQVFDNLSLEFSRGHTIAIVGTTGSGKTTLINLLMRLYDCSPDSIFVDDTDIRSFAIPSWLSHIALVSQDTHLLHDTLRANIAYSFEDTDDETILDVAKRARLHEFIESTPEGLDTIIGDNGVRLSGGEKQRLAIARALLKNSDILILDEATSALDSETELLIQEAIDEAVKDRTAIIIAHRLSTVRNADHVVVLQEGSCIEQGSIETLLEADGRFAEFWKKQQF